MLPWSGPTTDYHITVKEMIPVVIAGALWGSLWHGRTVLVQCDNAAVVSIVNHGSSKNEQAMHLARCLAFIMAKFNFHIVANHIKGVHNIKADALSRNNLPLLQSLYPQASEEGKLISQSLLDLLMVSKPDWTSQCWTELWSSSFNTA